MFSAAQNILSSHGKRLALAGGGIPSEVGKPLKPAVLCLKAAAYAVKPLNPK